uniref:Nucleolar protein 58/56 N-terminal domain-containing protein n=1 Tax=Oncorhynchus tshawytscha TaxID=74940 RepID=A0AAZ3RSS5_ONCTS
MLVLFETAAGYAIFKVLDESKLQEVDSLWKEFETPEKANKVVKLKHFEKFQDTTEALAGRQNTFTSPVVAHYSLPVSAQGLSVKASACFS